MLRVELHFVGFSSSHHRICMPTKKFIIYEQKIVGQKRQQQVLIDRKTQ